MSGSHCRHSQEGGNHHAKARALTVSSGMSRETRGGNGASALQDVRSFLSGAERVYQYPVDQITRVPTFRARTH